jgi:hypothetical protein
VGQIALISALALLGMAIRYVAYAWMTHQADVGGYVQALCNWDCNWYSYLALNGYDLTPREELGGLANWAFFPLTSILLSALHAALNVPVEVCGIVLGEVGIAAAALTARPLFGSMRAYWLFCILVLTGPFSYAYGIGMSESVFFLLSIVVFVGLKREHYVAVGLAGALITATRVTGILILIPIGLHFVTRLGLFATKTERTEAPDGNSIRWIVFALAITPLGLVAYMAYLQLLVGDALAFMHIQAAWDRAPGNPVQNIVDGLLMKTRGGYGLTMSIFAVLALSLSVVMLLRRRVGMALFTATSVILAASTGLFSMPRFVIGLSPVTIVAAELLGGGWVRFGIAVILALALCVVFSMLWMGGSPLMT